MQTVELYLIVPWTYWRWFFVIMAELGVYISAFAGFLDAGEKMCILAPTLNFAFKVDSTCFPCLDTGDHCLDEQGASGRHSPQQFERRAGRVRARTASGASPGGF